MHNEKFLVLYAVGKLRDAIVITQGEVKFQFSEPVELTEY